MECEKCFEDDETVEVWFCPFQKEINDELISCQCCKECFTNCLMDI
jgi:hypothetical protein